MSRSVDEESLSEILPTGRVSTRRKWMLAAVELLIYLVTCNVIAWAWAKYNGPPQVFAFMVAFTLYGVNLLFGLYQRAVYSTHASRLARSAISHGVSLVGLSLLCAVFIQDENAGFFVLGMVTLSYITTNTLRPVLVEVIRAGNELEQRRQPAKSVL